MRRFSYNQLFQRALITWLLFIPIVVLNGFMREALYKPFTGELRAHQISTVVASAAFLILAYFRFKNNLLTIPKNILFLIGAMWVALTVVFEFGLGRFILGNTWQKLFYDYNVLEGRIWILFLLTIFFTPVIIKQCLVIKTVNKPQYSK